MRNRFSKRLLALAGGLCELVLLVSVLGGCASRTGQEPAPAPEPHRREASDSAVDPSRVSSAFPPELLFEGRPIDPECLVFYAIDRDRFEPRDLRQCGLRGGGLELVEEEIEGRLFRREYVYTDSDDADNPVHTWSEYAFLGRVGPLVAIRAASQTSDGMGQFSMVQLIRRDGDTVRVGEELAQGDRCSGGVIEEPVVRDGVLYVDRMAMPDQILALFGDKSVNDRFARLHREEWMEHLLSVTYDCAAIVHTNSRGDHLGLRLRASYVPQDIRTGGGAEFTCAERLPEQRCDPFRGCFMRVMASWLDQAQEAAREGRARRGADSSRELPFPAMGEQDPRDAELSPRQAAEFVSSVYERCLPPDILAPDRP